MWETFVWLAKSISLQYFTVHNPLEPLLHPCHGCYCVELVISAATLCFEAIPVTRWMVFYGIQCDNWIHTNEQEKAYKINGTNDEKNCLCFCCSCCGKLTSIWIEIDFLSHMHICIHSWKWMYVKMHPWDLIIFIVELFSAIIITTRKHSYHRIPYYGLCECIAKWILYRIPYNNPI